MKAPRLVGKDAAWVVLLAAALPAQGELGDRLLAAARAEDHAARLAEVVRGSAIGELMDAMAARREALTQHLGARVVAALESRREELGPCWHDEPGRRRARAAAFAMMPFDWVEHLVHHPEDLADVEAVARGLPTQDADLAGHLRSADADRRRAAAALMKAAVAGERERGHPGVAVLRNLGKDALALRDLGAVLLEQPVSPFVLAPLFDDPDPRIRLRAAVRLRTSLRLAVPAHLWECLRGDPGADALPFAREGGAISDARMQTWLDAIRRGDRPLGVFTIGANGSPQLRRKLAQALIDQVRKVSPPEDGVHYIDPSRPNLDMWQQRAVWQALQLDPSTSVRMLADALNAVDAKRVLPAVQVAASSVEYVPPEVAQHLSPLVLTFLHHPDEAVRLAAANLGSVVLAVGGSAELRQFVVAHALAAARQSMPTLQLGRPSKVVLTDWDALPPGPPTDIDSVLVLAAARVGAQELAPLLVDAFVAAQKPGAVLPAGHEPFLQQCLEGLAPRLDAALADRVWTGLQARLRNPLAGDGPKSPATLVAGLAGSVSAANLPAVVAWIAGQRSLAVFAIEQVAPQLPAARLQVLLDAIGIADSRAQALLRFCPQKLVATWRAGPAHLAMDALFAIADWDWVERQRRAGVLPVDLIAATMAREITTRQPPLSLLVACRDEAVLVDALPSWLAAQPVGADDMPAWQQLAEAKAPVALAAARRLGGGGDAARALATAAVARLCGEHDLAVVRDALGVALELGLDVPGHAAVLERLAHHGDPATSLLCLAVRVRYDGLAADELPPAAALQVLAMSGVDVDIATCERLASPPRDQAVAWLLGSRSTVAVATALTVAASIEPWSESFERTVLGFTTHRDARVRAAAYTTLGQRDAALWACAGIVHEAAFDPEAVVRKVAASLRR